GSALRRRKVRFPPFPPGGESYVRSLAPPLPTKPAALGFCGDPRRPARTFAGREVVGAKSALLRFRQPGGENSARFLAPPLPTQTNMLGLRGDPTDCHAHVAAKNGFHSIRACGRALCEALSTLVLSAILPEDNH